MFYLSRHLLHIIKELTMVKRQSLPSLLAVISLIHRAFLQMLGGGYRGEGGRQSKKIIPTNLPVNISLL